MKLFVCVVALCSLSEALAGDPKAAVSASVTASAVCAPGDQVYPWPTAEPEGAWANHGEWQIPDTAIAPDAKTYLASGFPFLYRFEHFNPPAEQKHLWKLARTRGVADLDVVMPRFFTAGVRADLRDGLNKQKLRALVDHNPDEIVDAFSSNYHSSPMFLPNPVTGVMEFVGFERLVWNYEEKVYVHVGSVGKYDGRQARYRPGANGKLEFAGYRQLALPEGEGVTLAQKLAAYQQLIPVKPSSVTGAEAVQDITLNYASTWIRAKQIAFYKSLIRAGAAHTIGIYAPGPNGELVLASGSIVIAHRGVFWSLAAVTRNEADQEFPEITLKGMPFDQFPQQVRTRVRHLYSGAGALESAASMLYAQARGYTFVDIGAAYKGFGWEPVGGREIPIAEYWDRVLQGEQNPVSFRDAGSTGPIDITALLERAASVTNNPLQISSSDQPNRSEWEAVLRQREETQAERYLIRDRKKKWDEVKGDVRKMEQTAIAEVTAHAVQATGASAEKATKAISDSTGLRLRTNARQAAQEYISAQLTAGQQPAKADILQAAQTALDSLKAEALVSAEADARGTL